MFSFIYSLIPFFTIIVINALLIYEIKQQSLKFDTTSAKSKKIKALNKLVILLAVLFILMTLPSACKWLDFDHSVGRILKAFDYVLSDYWGTAE